MTPIQVGIIGCGNISDIYLKNGQKFEILDIVAVADLDFERAAAKAKLFDLQAYTPADLLADPALELVINLTIPAAHYEVSRAIIDSGKSVYSEKPLATQLDDGRQLLAAAQAKGVRVGCAPDTFLGGGLQTCRKLIDDGAIGQPVAATAFMMSHGPEGWHPNPDFFYQPGAGPLFDMGPYYLTTLAAMLGPIRRVTGSARISFPERIIGSGPRKGQPIQVNTPTHVAGLLDFASGAVGTLITSFDVWGSQLPRLEIYGSEGTLALPDPNTFAGPVFLRQAGQTEWREIKLTHSYTENSRGLGVADLAYALRSNRPHRANGTMALHVLEAMQAFLDASQSGCHVELVSRCEQPAALPAGLPVGVLDE
ncbi:MAG: Gfo/Idh/MocA family oxidoreductase [Anaerolineales bacterium]|nr:Gfo/Idh/MocA family oxidoreductase [Anaerolineales bacterium]